MLAGLRLADPQLRMLAAAPMDRQDDLARRVIDIGNDIGDKGAQQPLTRAHGHARRVPCGIEIVGQAGEVGARRTRVAGWAAILWPLRTALDGELLGPSAETARLSV